MSRKLFLISLLTIAAVTILLTLNAATDKPNEKKNGFVRNFLHLEINKIAGAEVGSDITNISAVNADSIFCFTPQPGEVYVISNHLKTVDTYTVKLPDIGKLKPLFTTFVAFPNIYVLGGNAKAYIEANLLTGTKKVKSLHTIGSFSRINQIDRCRYAVRVIDRKSLHAKFAILNTCTDDISLERNLSTELGDAGFINDGMLNYDPVSGKLVYVSYYHNEITCFDTSLSEIYKAHTIDTFLTSNATITKGGHNITHAAPAVTINGGNYAYNNRLYVKSNVVGDNEEPGVFSKNTVIDIYNLKKGIYFGSFYLPSEKKKLRAFQILPDQKIIALYNKQLIVYDMKYKTKDAFIF